MHSCSLILLNPSSQKLHYRKEIKTVHKYVRTFSKLFNIEVRKKKASTNHLDVLLLLWGWKAKKQIKKCDQE